MKKEIVISIVVLVALGSFVYINKKVEAPIDIPNQNDGEVIACTMDAMQCPDGSYVGRTGPKCEFVCPTDTGTNYPIEFEVALNKTKTIGGITITPIKVLEDSRCPVNVQCIQAGTVRLQTTLKSGMGEGTQIFTLNQPITTEVHTIELISVMPVAHTDTNINSRKYVFTFKISKRPLK